MSETFKHKTERLEHEPTLPSPEQHKNLPEHAEAIRKAEESQVENLVDAREQVAELAKTEHATLEQEAAVAAENKPDDYSGRINSELKAITFHRELNNIRRKLKPSEKVLSKAIHQPIVRVVSEVAGKTVSRPSGLLGGGIMALIGTSIYLYISKHVGLPYNYSVFLILFVGGFALGLILELVIHMTTASRRAHN